VQPTSRPEAGGGQKGARGVCANTRHFCHEQQRVSSATSGPTLHRSTSKGRQRRRNQETPGRQQRPPARAAGIRPSSAARRGSRSSGRVEGWFLVPSLATSRVTANGERMGPSVELEQRLQQQKQGRVAKGSEHRRGVGSFCGGLRGVGSLPRPSPSNRRKMPKKGVGSHYQQRLGRPFRRGDGQAVLG